MKRLFSIIMTCLLVVALAGCGNAANKPADTAQTENKQAEEKKETPAAKLKTVVTILPQMEWVQAVAGDLAEVTALLPPGASPEVYQASPKEMIALEEADLYFTISVPVEVEGIIPNTVTKAKVVDLAAAAAEKYPELSFADDDDDDHDHEHEHEHKEDAHSSEKADEHKETAEHKEDAHSSEKADEHKETAEHKEDAHSSEKADEHKETAEHKEDAKEHDHDHESGEEHEHHHHSGRDPHIWMSPKRVAAMVEAIRDALIAADEKNAETYKRNAEAYLQKLGEADKQLADVLAQAKVHSFIIMHPSMGYFADDYGLMQVSIEKEGKQATAEHLKTVIDYAKDNDIKVVFYQKEFDNNQAKTIAAEIGGEVMELEPLAPNYLENLEKLKEVFTAVLK